MGSVLGVLAITSCSNFIYDSPDSGTAEGKILRIHLAFSVRDNAATKADAAVLTEIGPDPLFRGMDSVRVLPFLVDREVQEGDEARTRFLQLPAIGPLMGEKAWLGGSDYYTGLVQNNRAHLYSDAVAWLPEGCASVLVYALSGSITNYGDTPEGKHTYGSLVERGFSLADLSPAVSGIGFSPDPMVGSGTLPQEALLMAQTLTSLLQNASFTGNFFYNGAQPGSAVVRWNADCPDLPLRELFHNITNDGYLISGSGVHISRRLTALYTLLSSASTDQSQYWHTTPAGDLYPAFCDVAATVPFTNAMLFDGLRAAIRSKMNLLITAEEPVLSLDAAGGVLFSNERVQGYPQSLGLPAGAAALRWSAAGFAPAAEKIDGVAPITRYCYPPSLYYYSNTLLRTTQDAGVRDRYTSQLGWDGILAYYQPGRVLPHTVSVALDQPLQYACGLMVATVKASASFLQDNAEGLVELTSENFPVTGIIVGGQHDLRYDFTPVTDSEEYFLYDNQLSGVYLTPAQSAPFRTLVMQTPVNQDIPFCLELQNNSGQEFYGVQGRVLPGSRFYLAGKLELSPSTVLRNVFLQDYYTTVNCTVESLKAAHNAVPDLSDPHLSLGIRTRVNWSQSNPTAVILN